MSSESSAAADGQHAAFVEILEDGVRGGRTLEAAAKRLGVLGHDQVAVDAAVKEYLRRTRRVRELKEPNTVLDGNLPAPWYAGPRDDDSFWPALKRQLIAQGWEKNQPGVIESIDTASTRILSLLPNPGTPEFSARGLVIGYVQSGKTANLTSVMAKAADAGYRLFLVLSGLTTALRRQTQLRVARDLTSPTEKHWLWLTDEDEDFWQRSDVAAYLSDNQNARVVGVIKKNKHVLTKLKEWLNSAKREIRASCPILIIDDEADQASPNASGTRDSRTAINQLIIDILTLLPRVAYVGYTATPFANLLINTEVDTDLYPRDFVVDLPKGKSYFGPERIFGRDTVDGEESGEAVAGLDMIRPIPNTPDNDEVPLLRPTKANRHTFTPTITPSLETALRYFILATAARWTRGQDKQHSTMLVHSSEYVAAHWGFEGPLRAASSALAQRLASGDSALLNDLRKLWEDEQAKVPSKIVGLAPVPFAELAPHLKRVASKIDIRLEFGGAVNRLSYDEDPPGGVYIVIGGNVVSRGLTLEGLVVTHFVRSASAYDTLLQMGRWFGYRVGYEDLPRIWLTDSLKQFFRHLALVEQEIRYSVERYKDGALTPKQFAVRIRTHPILAVTSRLKTAFANTIKVSFAGQAPQTILFRAKDPAWLRRNYDAAKSLISRTVASGRVFGAINGRPDLVAEGVGNEIVLQFLQEYTIAEEHAELDRHTMSAYIRAQNAHGRLKKWNVAIVGSRRAPLGRTDIGLPQAVPLLNRSASNNPRADDLTDIRALMSALDIVMDVPPSAALEEADSRPKRLKFRDEVVPDTGLLLLYPIARDSRPGRKDSGKRRALEAADHVIGLGLVFPDPADNTPQDYMVANVRQLDWDDTYEEDDIVDPEDDEPTVP